MATYILKRLLQIPFPLLVVSLVVFLALRLTGDPVELLLGLEATPEERAVMREKLGLNAPLLLQYGRFLQHAVTGDFGTSLRFKEPALALVLGRLPSTLALAAVGLVLATLLGMALGVLAAWRRGSTFDLSLVSLGVLGQSVPSFWLGILLIMLFAVQWRILPTSGTGDWRHLVLPGVTLASFILPQVTLLTRSSMLDVLNENYITVARAKGLGALAVMLHALKNAVHPVIAYLGLQTGTLVGGSIITETIFSWPGIGQLTIQSIYNRDVVVVEAAVLVMALAIVLSNLLADVLNAGLDPRIRVS
jgi:ABC-type dipeptide/oligopeptide/nickel transport system permease component